MNNLNLEKKIITIGNNMIAALKKLLNNFNYLPAILALTPVVSEPRGYSTLEIIGGVTVIVVGTLAVAGVGYLAYSYFIACSATAATTTTLAIKAAEQTAANVASETASSVISETCTTLSTYVVSNPANNVLSTYVASAANNVASNIVSTVLANPEVTTAAVASTTEIVARVLVEVGTQTDLAIVTVDVGVQTIGTAIQALPVKEILALSPVPDQQAIISIFSKLKEIATPILDAGHYPSSFKNIFSDPANFFTNNGVSIRGALESPVSVWTRDTWAKVLNRVPLNFPDTKGVNLVDYFSSIRSQGKAFELLTLLKKTSLPHDYFLSVTTTTTDLTSYHLLACYYDTFALLLNKGMSLGAFNAANFMIFEPIFLGITSLGIFKGLAAASNGVATSHPAIITTLVTNLKTILSAGFISQVPHQSNPAIFIIKVAQNFLEYILS
jgi:hypothetical protein